MHETFVPLRQWLAPASAVAPTPPPDQQSEPTLEPAPILAEEGDDDVARDARIFQAALRESLDEHVRVLVKEIAIEVVARELALAPADIANIVEHARARYGGPLSIRVHPDEAQNLCGFENVVSDETIRRGDVLLAIAGGAIDASLGMRLSRVLSVVLA